MTCPDCKQPWPDGPKCPSCGLDLNDLEDAAAFLEGST